MIVVADTSPLNYLVLIDEIDLLPAIFAQVLFPHAVFEELRHPKTSGASMGSRSSSVARSTHCGFSA